MDRKTDLRLWAVAFWLAVWQIAAMALAAVYPHGELLLASPVDVLLRLGQLAVTAAFWRTVAWSAVRIFGGFLLATVLAVALAALAAWKQWLRGLMAPLVAAVKAVPVASFIILALVWLNSRSLSLFISALMVFPPVYLNVLEGIRRTDRQLLEMARVFRVPVSRHLPHGPSASGNGPGVPGPPWAAAPGHLSAAGDALFPHGGIFGPGALLESRGSGGDHRLARRVHGRAAVHRQGLLPDGRSVRVDRHHRGGVSGI